MLRMEWAGGISRKDAALLLNVTPKAIAEKVKNLGIQRRQPEPERPSEPSIPHFVHHQAVTDYRTWDQQRHCYINNHLYREPVSLAAVW